MSKRSEFSAPKGLSKDAQRLWLEISLKWTLTSETAELLAIAVHAKTRAEGLRALLATEGLVVRDRPGAAPRAHPALKGLKESEDTLIRALRAMGLE